MIPSGMAVSRYRSAAVSGDQRISTFDRVGSIGRCVVERLSELEKWRIAELAAQGLPSRVIGKEIGRAHRTVWGYIRVLRRPPVPERKRSALRLSLTEREEISRGLAGGESRRSIARRLGRSPSTILREVTVNGGVRRYRGHVALMRMR
jgi:IS30 family transposase